TQILCLFVELLQAARSKKNTLRFTGIDKVIHGVSKGRTCVYADGARGYCCPIFFSVIRRPQRLDSALTNPFICSGPPATISNPASFSRADTSGVFNAAFTSSLKRFKVVSGVCMGAIMPTQE